jgi:hypothetical protein
MLPALWKQRLDRHIACHLPATRCEGQRATGRTHRTQSKGCQATPVPHAQSTAERAVRTRAIAHFSRQVVALGR